MDTTQSGLGAFGFTKAELLSRYDEGEEFGDVIFKTVSLMQTFKRKHLMPYKIGSYIMTKCSGD